MKFLRNLRDVFISSLPLVVIVAIVCSFATLEKAELFQLITGYLFVLFGQTFFLIGIDNVVLPIGKLVGGSLSRLNRTSFILLFGFVFGLLATVAEPSITILGTQLHSINPDINVTLFVWIVGSGIGIGVATALFRVIRDINIKICFCVLYILLFSVILIIPEQFQAVAFDASGATTGDVSVPFILALGVGVSSTMSKSKTNEESFGIIGLASVGPIVAVLLYGLVLGNGNNLKNYTAGADETLSGVMISNLCGVALTILPIIAIFFVFQFFFIKLPRKHLLRILVSSFVLYIGLFFFLSGIDYGFALAGKHIGDAFMDNTRPSWFKWLLLPIGLVLGFSVALSQPAVTVLGEQVEEITNSFIKKMTIRLTLAIGLGISVFLAMLKVLTGIDIVWFLIPMYAIAIISMIFAPKLFVGLAFDSGGVASGAMISAFLTPLTLGASQTLNQDILTSGFGTIAFVAAMPLILVQWLGIIYSYKRKRAIKSASHITLNELDSLSHSAK
ncbi:MAG: DUF1538 domain-containing protein [Christensenellaceae bacterium]|jgi:hypothetical protein|nr:DUF1538 domain-containing protein [Christensenellaceae bacterium]